MAKSPFTDVCNKKANSNNIVYYYYLIRTDFYFILFSYFFLYDIVTVILIKHNRFNVLRQREINRQKQSKINRAMRPRELGAIKVNC